VLATRTDARLASRGEQHQEGREEDPERIAAAVELQEVHEDPERYPAADAVAGVLVEVPQRGQDRRDRNRRPGCLDLVGFMPSAHGGADERDDQPGEAADRDVHRPPPHGHERHEVRGARHPGDQQVREREQEAEHRPERTRGTGTEVSTATAAIASAAHTGWLPVAKPTTVSTRVQPAAARARRRAIPDGPADADAATIAPASADSSVALLVDELVAFPRSTSRRFHPGGGS
jgi:hypothetical protein